MSTIRNEGGTRQSPYDESGSWDDSDYYAAQDVRAGEALRDKHGPAMWHPGETLAELPYDPLPEQYAIADAAIGDVQYWLIRFKRPLVKDAFEAAFKILAARRAELRKEREGME